MTEQGNVGLERIVSDYRTEFNDTVSELFDTMFVNGRMIPRSIRIKNCYSLIDDYYDKYKEYPTNFVLDRMATYILKKDNQGRKGFKMERDGEYPILSESQMERRYTREVNLGQAVNYDNKKQEHTPPTRFERINSEINRRFIK